MALDTLFVERLAKASLFTPPHPPLSTLPSGSCFVGVSSLTCPLHSRCTPQPRIPSQQPFHPIYAPETVWSGKRETPPLPKPPVPRILGVVKSMRPPSWRTTKMCRRSRIPKSIANTGDHPQTSQGNLRGLSAAFRPFLDVIKL